MYGPDDAADDRERQDNDREPEGSDAAQREPQVLVEHVVRHFLVDRGDLAPPALLMRDDRIGASRRSRRPRRSWSGGRWRGGDVVCVVDGLCT